jgi:serine/threonine-protein kinase PknG
MRKLRERMPDQPTASQEIPTSVGEIVALVGGSGSRSSDQSGPSLRRRFGAGLVELPPVAPIDPTAAILDNPEVTEKRRSCWRCGAPVGQQSEGGVVAVTGECPRCEAPFNFRPILQPGEVVAEQYEVQGCLARGGLGWVYLAIDRNVSDRWVVLKGLRNNSDFEAQVVALAERQFLSEMAHPAIVEIHNFVKHRSATGVSGGYIVMEYVGGRSLRKVLEACAPERVPLAEAIAYMMEILPALGYLHTLGLAYNDLKPDNIMVSDDAVKLIDLGAVTALESYDSVYITPGYQAPETTKCGPTVASDIYTAGRTLAVLTMKLPLDADGHLKHGIPGPDDQPLLGRYPSFHRLLLRATDSDPARRFRSAQAMNNQLGGVLRAVLSADTGREHPQVSTVFGSLRGSFGIDGLIELTDELSDGVTRSPELDPESVVSALPVPLIDGGDPSADLVATTLHGKPREALEALRRARERIDAGALSMPSSFELEGGLALARAHLDLGEVAPAREVLGRLTPRHGADWRVQWYDGIVALLERRYVTAFDSFDSVHGIVPGEVAPMLALAATAELALHYPEAAAERERWRRLATDYYRTVWRTDRGAVSAAFGFARQLADNCDHGGAVAALDDVSVMSRHFQDAQLTGALLLASRPPAELTVSDLAAAVSRVQSAPGERRVLQLRVVVLKAALRWLRTADRAVTPNALIPGIPFTEWGIRRALEAGQRELARRTPQALHRYRLVDEANRIRPRSWW